MRGGGAEEMRGGGDTATAAVVGHRRPSGQRRRLRAVYSPFLVSESIGAGIHKYSINAVNQSNSVTCQSNVANT